MLETTMRSWSQRSDGSLEALNVVTVCRLCIEVRSYDGVGSRILEDFKLVCRRAVKLATVTLDVWSAVTWSASPSCSWEARHEQRSPRPSAHRSATDPCVSASV